MALLGLALVLIFDAGELLARSCMVHPGSAPPWQPDRCAWVPGWPDGSYFASGFPCGGFWPAALRAWRASLLARRLGARRQPRPGIRRALFWLGLVLLLLASCRLEWSRL